MREENTEKKHNNNDICRHLIYKEERKRNEEILNIE
jgi:hypothetical protein